MRGDPTIDVFLEVVRRRSFAIAAAWPGWARSGRDEDGAIDALLRAGPRYAAVAAAAGLDVALPADRSGLVVVARLPGGAGTEFGVPSLPLPGDDDPLDPAGLDRQVALLRASWAAFDAAVERNLGVELAKGPRGGGRDLPKIVAHVEEADAGYLGQLGVRAPAGRDGSASIAAVHAAAIAALRARAQGQPVENPSRVTKPWSLRRYVRRAAWHWLDHAWEIEDRAIRSPG